MIALRADEFQRTEKVLVDGRYVGKPFEEFVRDELDAAVEVAKRTELQTFAVIPKRWVVERTFGWFNGQRRLSKDYEKLTKTSEAMLFIAAIARSFRNPLFISTGSQ